MGIVFVFHVGISPTNESMSVLCWHPCQQFREGGVSLQTIYTQTGINAIQKFHKLQ
jgi:hypothetical protein